MPDKPPGKFNPQRFGPRHGDTITDARRTESQPASVRSQAQAQAQPDYRGPPVFYSSDIPYLLNETSMNDVVTNSPRHEVETLRDTWTEQAAAAARLVAQLEEVYAPYQMIEDNWGELKAKATPEQFDALGQLLAKAKGSVTPVLERQREVHSLWTRGVKAAEKELQTGLSTLIARDITKLVMFLPEHALGMNMDLQTSRGLFTESSGMRLPSNVRSEEANIYAPYLEGADKRNREITGLKTEGVLGAVERNLAANSAEGLLEGAFELGAAAAPLVNEAILGTAEADERATLDALTQITQGHTGYIAQTGAMRKGELAGFAASFLTPAGLGEGARILGAGGMKAFGKTGKAGAQVARSEKLRRAFDISKGMRERGFLQFIPKEGIGVGKAKILKHSGKAAELTLKAAPKAARVLRDAGGATAGGFVGFNADSDASTLDKWKNAFVGAVGGYTGANLAHLFKAKIGLQSDVAREALRLLDEAPAMPFDEIMEKAIDARVLKGPQKTLHMDAAAGPENAGAFINHLGQEVLDASQHAEAQRLLQVLDAPDPDLLKTKEGRKEYLKAARATAMAEGMGLTDENLLLYVHVVNPELGKALDPKGKGLKGMALRLDEVKTTLDPVSEGTASAAEVQAKKVVAELAAEVDDEGAKEVLEKVVEEAQDSGSAVNQDVKALLGDEAAIEEVPAQVATFKKGDVGFKKGPDGHPVMGEVQSVSFDQGSYTYKVDFEDGTTMYLDEQTFKKELDEVVPLGEELVVEPADLTKPDMELTKAQVAAKELEAQAAADFEAGHLTMEQLLALEVDGVPPDLQQQLMEVMGFTPDKQKKLLQFSAAEYAAKVDEAMGTLFYGAAEDVASFSEELQAVAELLKEKGFRYKTATEHMQFYEKNHMALNALSEVERARVLKLQNAYSRATPGSPEHLALGTEIDEFLKAGGQTVETHKALATLGAKAKSQKAQEVASPAFHDMGNFSLPAQEAEDFFGTMDAASREFTAALDEVGFQGESLTGVGADVAVGLRGIYEGVEQGKMKLLLDGLDELESALESVEAAFTKPAGDVLELQKANPDQFQKLLDRHAEMVLEKERFTDVLEKAMDDAAAAKGTPAAADVGAAPKTTKKANVGQAVLDAEEAKQAKLAQEAEGEGVRLDLTPEQLTFLEHQFAAAKDLPLNSVPLQKIAALIHKKLGVQISGDALSGAKPVIEHVDDAGKTGPAGKLGKKSNSKPMILKLDKSAAGTKVEAKARKALRDLDWTDDATKVVPKSPSFGGVSDVGLRNDSLSERKLFAEESAEAGHIPVSREWNYETVPPLNLLGKMGAFFSADRGSKFFLKLPKGKTKKGLPKTLVASGKEEAVFAMGGEEAVIEGKRIYDNAGQPGVDWQGADKHINDLMQEHGVEVILDYGSKTDGFQVIVAGETMEALTRISRGVPLEGMPTLSNLMGSKGAKNTIIYGTLARKARAFIIREELRPWNPVHREKLIKWAENEKKAAAKKAQALGVLFAAAAMKELSPSDEDAILQQLMDGTEDDDRVMTAGLGGLWDGVRKFFKETQAAKVVPDALDDMARGLDHTMTALERALMESQDLAFNLAELQFAKTLSKKIGKKGGHASLLKESDQAAIAARVGDPNLTQVSPFAGMTSNFRLWLSRKGGPMLKKMMSSVREAELIRNAYAIPMSQTVKAMFGHLPEETSTRIFHALDDPTEQLFKTLSADEQKVALAMRGVFDSLLAMQNKVRKARGLAPVKRTQGYVTHFFESTNKDTWQLGRDTRTRDMHNKFLEKRKGAEGYVADAARAVDVYMDAALRDMIFSPMYAQFTQIGPLMHKSLQKPVQKMMDLASGRYMSAVDKAVWGGMQAGSETALTALGHADAPGAAKQIVRRAQRMWDGVNTFVYYKGLGMSPRAALVNMGQNHLTIADVGARHTMQAVSDVMRGAPGIEAEIRKVVRDIDLTGHVYEAEVRKAYSLAQKVVDGPLGMGWFDASERFNRRVSALAGLRDAAEKGLTGRAAVEHARDVVERTQFWYLASGRPGVFSALGRAGRPFAAFKSFPVRSLDFFTQQVGRYVDARKAGNVEEANRIRKSMMEGIGSMAVAAGTASGLGIYLDTEVGFTPAEMAKSVFDSGLDRETMTKAATSSPLTDLAFALGSRRPGAPGVGEAFQEFITPAWMNRLQKVVNAPSIPTGPFPAFDGRGIGNSAHGPVYITRRGQSTGTKATVLGNIAKGLGFRSTKEHTSILDMALGQEAPLEKARNIRNRTIRRNAQRSRLFTEGIRAMSANDTTRYRDAIKTLVAERIYPNHKAATLAMLRAAVRAQDDPVERTLAGVPEHLRESELSR